MQALSNHGKATVSDREPWTKTVEDLAKKKAEAADGFDGKKSMLEALWNSDGSDEKDSHGESQQSMLRRYLTHMALSNTITPVYNEKTKKEVFQRLRQMSWPCASLPSCWDSSWYVIALILKDGRSRV